MRHRLALDGVRENLREQHPHHRAPREREAGDVGDDCDERDGAYIAGGEQRAEREHRHGHHERAEHEQRLRPQRSTVTSATSVNTTFATPTMMVWSSDASVEAPMFLNMSGA